MKKGLTAALLFILAFVGTYLALSVSVPDLANPSVSSAEHFLAENLSYLVGLKVVLSMVVGLFLAMAPWLYRKHDRTE